jgi:F420-dependent oxidoreductase-like protein
MKIGLQVNRFTWPGGDAAIGPKLAEIARTADQAGFASFWVMDHFFQLEGMIGPASEPMLEAYTTLGFVAGVTQHMKLGTLVTGNIYRRPGLLVKAVTTLDVLSGGRAYLGIGAGWYEREAIGLGFGFPSTKERFELLEETLQIVHKMWSGDTSGYVGNHNALTETLSSPAPVSQPHPRILIGGGGEKKTLRFVAQYADACNLMMFNGMDALRSKLDILQRHCDAVGRDYDLIEKTALGMVNLGQGGMKPSDVIGMCRQMAGLGFSHLILGVPNVEEIAPLEVFGRQIIPAVSGF